MGTSPNLGEELQDSAESTESTLSSSLERLMHHRTPDGRYLVTRKVHWQAIFRILVDRGIYPDGTDYRGFCCYMEEVFPTAECRVPLDYHSLKTSRRLCSCAPLRSGATMRSMASAVSRMSGCAA